MVDQFLKGETMRVHKVEAATTELQLHNVLLGPGGWQLGKTPSCTSIILDRDNSGDWNLGLTSLVLAASCWQCCTSGLNTVRNAAVSGARSNTSSWLLQQVWREHVICEDWVHRMPSPLRQPGKGGDDLGHGDRQHC